MRLLLSIFFIINYKKLVINNKYSIVLIKIYIIGTCTSIFFFENPSLSIRLSDLFIAFDIVTIPLLFYQINNRIISNILVITISSSYLFQNLYYNQIFTLLL